MSFATLRRLAMPLLVIAACTSDPDPIDSAGTIVKIPGTAAALFNDSVAFYAKVNRDDEGFIYFKTASGARGEKFARIRIRQRSLAARPDGTPFGPNDSVLIVMKVVNPLELGVELSPSGIHFNASDPAELRIEYTETKGDLNGDGKKDGDDDKIEQKLALWRQEKPGDPLVKIGTVKTEGLKELKADLVSFSRYYIAY